MAITITIGGVDKTSLCIINTLNISDELNSRNTCSLNLVDPAGAYRPAVGNEIIVSKGAIKIFAGTIDSIDEEKLQGNNALYYNLQCVDYNQLCDRYTVAEEYEDELAGDIFKAIIDNFMQGESITYVNVQDGDTITKAIFNYQTANQAYNEIAELTGYAWYIDYDKDMHFFSRETNFAPLSLSDSSDNFRNMRVTRTREEYRNRQYVRAGYDMTDSRTDSFKGDGARRTFTCKYPLAKVPAVTVDSVAQTVGIKGIDTGKAFYWNKNEKEITQDDSESVLTSSNTLAVTYQGYFPIIVQTDREDAIVDRISVEGGNGIYESVLDEPSIDTQDAAQAKADAYLRKYGEIPETIEFETDEDGLAAGQLIEIDITAHNLDDTYLISRVAISDLVSDTLRYRVAALSGEYIGGWVDFFKKMAKSGQQYVIRENEVLIKIKKFVDTCKAADTFTVSSASPEQRIGYIQIGFGEVA